MPDTYIPSHPGPFTFRPIIPEITVLRITKREELQKVAEDMRLAPELFPQLQEYGHRPTLRVLNKELVVKNGIADRGGNMDAIVLKFGDYLVQSENGQRFITDQSYVRHGVLKDLPPTMFYPIEGERITPDMEG